MELDKAHKAKNVLKKIEEIDRSLHYIEKIKDRMPLKGFEISIKDNVGNLYAFDFTDEIYITNSFGDILEKRKSELLKIIENL